MWRSLRIALLLLVLVGVAGQTWLDRHAARGWHHTLWVGVFPVNADGSDAAQAAVAALSAADFADIASFFQRESHRYGLALPEPVHVTLYPAPEHPPPALPPQAGPLGILWWSLQLRWYAARELHPGPAAPPRVRILLLLHDPAQLGVVPDSHGLEKGLIGIVHGFALRAQYGGNNIVLAHELMHVLGATDKYRPDTLAPLFPQGYADPQQVPLHPQARAEIMAGRRALSDHDFDMPASLRDVIVGPRTAREIGWSRS